MKKTLIQISVIVLLVLIGQFGYIQTQKWVIQTNKEYVRYSEVNASFLEKMNAGYKKCESKLNTISTTDPEWIVERDVAAICTKKVTSYWKPMRKQVIDALDKGKTKFQLARALRWIE